MLVYQTGSDLERPKGQVARLDGRQACMNGRLYDDSQDCQDHNHAHSRCSLQLHNMAADFTKLALKPLCTLLLYDEVC